MSLYEIPVLKVVGGQQTREQICTRIENIDLIISKIEAAMLLDDSSPSMVEYELDTGQTKSRVKLSSIDQMVSTLEKLQLMRDRLAVKLKPRIARLVPGSSFRNNF